MKTKYMIIGAILMALVIGAPFIMASGTDTTTTSASVTNEPPIGSSAVLNNGADLTLFAATNTSFNGTVVITDNNGCDDIAAVNASLFIDTVTIDVAPGPQYKYDVMCSPLATAANTCDGVGDLDETYICYFDVQYFANATDGSAFQTAANWNFSAYAFDVDGLTTQTPSGRVDTQQDINSLIDLNVTEPAIAYGQLNLSFNSSNHGDGMQNVTLVNQGNQELDMVMSGTNMTCTIGNITTYNETGRVTGQYFSNETIYGMFDYGEIGGFLHDGLALPEEAPVTRNGNYNLITASAIGSPSTDKAFWLIGLPKWGIGGDCTGVNTLTGLKSS